MAIGTTGEKAYWVAFSRITGLGAARMQQLAQRFGSLSAAWRAGDAEILFSGLPASVTDEMLRARPAIDPPAELAALERKGVSVVTLADADYPESLRNIPAPPALLYFHGSLAAGDHLAIAVVGTRKPSRYGLEATRRVVTDLARAGITIVSGMALGIDAAAHQAALDAGGRTLAVLGCGLDVVYPSGHRGLAERIASQGALLTEFALGTKPEARNFPIRNRIVSGLCHGTLVVEAGERSGALITAQFALEQNRDTYAIPGGIFWPTSQGTNRLLQHGEAKLVTRAGDILEEMDVRMVTAQAEARSVIPAGGNEAQVLAHLSFDPIHVDELGRAAGLPMAVVSSTLALLELKGMVSCVGGMNYVRAPQAGLEYSTR